MCRMLGVVPKGSSFIDSELVNQFRNLASKGKVKRHSSPGHGDGWGMVAWHLDAPYYLGRESNDASSDPKFDEALRKLQQSHVTTPLLVHLRKASAGNKVRENTHPFVKEKWAFAHNGAIRKLNLKDRTDSEWFFESLLEELKQCGGDVVCAVARQVEAVREIYQYSSMTFLLSDGISVFAYRDCTNSEDYYSLYYTLTDKAFVVCQEKIFESSWKELANGQLLSVDRRLHREIADINALLGEANKIPAQLNAL